MSLSPPAPFPLFTLLQENVTAKAKRELLEQKLKRDATVGKTYHDIYREMAMKHSVGEEKYQRALAAYNGRREHESVEEETEVFLPLPPFPD
jgi:hypothetical protein